MRLLSVSSTGGTISITAGSSSHHDIHGFSINLLESQPSRLRFRSVQFGNTRVVSLLLGEVDGAAEAPGTSMEEDVYIIVGTDEGLTEATLLRIAALISEICIFLRVSPKYQGNLYLLRMVLMYMDQRIGCFDLAFLGQAVETVFNPAITATGYSSNPKGLLDELVRANLFDEPGENERMPGYVGVLFGNKMLMETTPHVAEEAAKANDLDKFTLNDADRYLIYILTCAFFAVPHPAANGAMLARTQRIEILERHLSKFEIHRHNATRAAARDTMAMYCDMLRETKPNGKSEEKAAKFYSDCYAELVSLVGTTSTVSPAPPDDKDETSSSEPPLPHERNRYHSPDVDFEFLESQVFLIPNCYFRNSDYAGDIQLLWAPSPAAAPEEWHMADICPGGYGLCIVYFPPRNEKEYQRIQSEYTVMVPVEPLRALAGEVLGSVEMSFNRFQWLLSPPVESYETPGLIHFIAIDRRDNSCVCGSFERMMHQKQEVVCQAVRELHRTMSQCISKAHELISAGFSEGLWGHLGMQFFYAVGVAPPPEGNNAGRAGGNANANSGGGGGNNPQDSNSQPSGVFSNSVSDSKKIPNSIIQHLVLRPMLIPDFVEDSKQIRVIEMYCMFVGCMSPQEVCQSVEWLRSSRLFS